MPVDLSAVLRHRAVNGGDGRKARSQQERGNVARLLVNVLDGEYARVQTRAVAFANHVLCGDGARVDLLVLNRQHAGPQRPADRFRQGQRLLAAVVAQRVILALLLRGGTGFHAYRVQHDFLRARDDDAAVFGRQALALLVGRNVLRRVKNIDKDQRSHAALLEVNLHRFAERVVCQVVRIAEILARLGNILHQNRLVDVRAAAFKGMHRRCADVDDGVLRFRGDAAAYGLLLTVCAVQITVCHVFCPPVVLRRPAGLFEIVVDHRIGSVVGVAVEFRRDKAVIERALVHDKVLVGVQRIRQIRFVQK